VLDDRTYKSELQKKSQEAIAYEWARFKKFGRLFLVGFVATSLVLKGMPLHRFWPIFGQLILLVTAVLFARTVQWGGLALGSWWLEKDFEKDSRTAVHVAPDELQKRSGRRRPREYPQNK
jgi:hypothetical protein